MRIENFFFRLRVDLLNFLPGSDLVLQNVSFEFFDGVFFAPLFDFLRRPNIGMGPLDIVVRSDMAVHPVGKTFEEDRAFPPAAQVDGFPRGPMNLQHIVPIHPMAQFAERDPQLVYFLADSNLIDRKMRGIEVVLANEDDGQPPQRREIQRSSPPAQYEYLKIQLMSARHASRSQNDQWRILLQH